MAALNGVLANDEENVADLFPVQDDVTERGSPAETGLAVQRNVDSMAMRTVHREQAARAVSWRQWQLNKATRLIWLATAMLEFLFMMRFVLKLIDANPSAGFAIFIYSVSRLFLLPFLGLTIMPSFGGAVLEIPTLIAMIVYAIWVWLIVRIVWVVFDESEAV